MGSKILTCCAPRRNSDTDGLSQNSRNIKSAPSYENVISNSSTNQTTCENIQSRNSLFSFSFQNCKQNLRLQKINLLKSFKKIAKKKYIRDFEEEYMWNDIQDLREQKKYFQTSKSMKNFSITYFSKNKKIFKQNEENIKTSDIKMNINNDINKHFRLKRRCLDELDF